MADAQIKMACTRCGNKVPFMTMSYGADKESLLCQHCKQAETPKKEAAPKKDKYVCNACNFKFGLISGKKNVICPYCSSKDVDPAQARSADNLLKDSILE